MATREISGHTTGAFVVRQRDARKPGVPRALRLLLARLQHLRVVCASRSHTPKAPVVHATGKSKKEECHEDNIFENFRF